MVKSTINCSIDLLDLIPELYLLSRAKSLHKDLSSNLVSSLLKPTTAVFLLPLPLSLSRLLLADLFVCYLRVYSPNPHFQVHLGGFLICGQSKSTSSFISASIFLLCCLITIQLCWIKLWASRFCRYCSNIYL